MHIRRFRLKVFAHQLHGTCALDLRIENAFTIYYLQNVVLKSTKGPKVNDQKAARGRIHTQCNIDRKLNSQAKLKLSRSAEWVSSFEVPKQK